LRAPVAALPHAPRVFIYDGPEHGGLRLAELHWSPADGPAKGKFLDEFMTWEQREADNIGAILTVRTAELKLSPRAAHVCRVSAQLYDVGGVWRQVTLAKESVGVSGEWGWFAAGEPRLPSRASRAAPPTPPRPRTPC
jgi:hypothetical protein